MRNTAVIMEDAMNCLINNLGIVETEVFISNLIREPFDYTKWQHEKFDGVTLDEFCGKAVEYCKNNPVHCNNSTLKI